MPQRPDAAELRRRHLRDQLRAAVRDAKDAAAQRILWGMAEDLAREKVRTLRAALARAGT